MIREQPPSCRRRSSGHAGSGRVETLEAGCGRSPPASAAEAHSGAVSSARSARCARPTLKSPRAGQAHPASQPVDEDRWRAGARHPPRPCPRKPVAWRSPTISVSVSALDTHHLAHPSLLPPGEPFDEPEPETPCLCAPEAERVQHHLRCSRIRRSGPSRIALAWPVNAERSSPWLTSVSTRPSSAGSRERPERRAAARRRRSPPCRSSGRAAGSAQTGNLLQDDDVGAVGADQLDHLARGAPFEPGGQVLPWKRFQVRTSTHTTVRRRCASSSRTQPAFTPQYDHELAAGAGPARARTSSSSPRFRFGEAPAPADTGAASSSTPSRRGSSRSRLRLPLKAVEHLAGLARAARITARRPARPVAGGATARPLFRPRARRFHGHDLLPRRTARRKELWSDSRPLRPRRRPQRAWPGDARELGVDAVSDPAPRLPSDPSRADDGRTVLSLGRDPAVQGPGRRDRGRRAGRRSAAARRGRSGRARSTATGAAAGIGGVAARLPGEAELDRALGESTVALFPYRAELDQSARSCKRSARASRRSPTTSAGLPSRSCLRRRPRRAGRDVDGAGGRRTRTARRPRRARAARAGARERRAADLGRAAAAHIRLYEELL